MHAIQTRPTAADVLVRQSVCHAASLGFGVQNKTDERIEVLLGVKTLGSPRHIMLDRGSDLQRRGEGEAHSMQLLLNYFGFLSCCRTV